MSEQKDKQGVIMQIEKEAGALLPNNTIDSLELIVKTDIHGNYYWAPKKPLTKEEEAEEIVRRLSTDASDWQGIRYRIYDFNLCQEIVL